MFIRLKTGLMLNDRRVMGFMAYNALFHIGLMGIFDVVLNFYYVSLGYDIATIGLLQSLPRLGGLLTSIPMGLVTNRVGTYRVILYATIGISITLVAMVVFPTLALLVVSRFMLGFLYGAQQIALAPLMGALVDKTQHTRFFAYHNVVSMASMSFGSLIGGSVPSFMVMLFTPFVPIASVVNAQTSFAYGASLVLAALIVLLSALPFAQVGDVNTPNTPQNMLEKPKRMPIPWRVLIVMCLPMVTFGFTGGLTFPFFNLFFRTQFSVPDQTVGTILSIGWLGMALVPLANGIWEHRLGRAGALGLLLTISAIGFVGLGNLSSLVLTIPAFVIAVSFRNTMQTLFQPLLMSHVSQPLHNVVSSVSMVLWNVGWMTATILSGYLQATFGYTVVMEIVAVGVLFTGLSVVIIFRNMPKAK